MGLHRSNAGPHRGAAYRSPNAGNQRHFTRYPSLTAGQVRGRQFLPVRRGLDPAEVHRFLDRVADELAAAQAELAWTRAENIRIKQALRSWQSRFTPRFGG